MHIAEVNRLQQITRDLVAISTLSAIWGGLPPDGVIKSLADVLRNMLGLDLVYVRLGSHDGHDSIETIYGNRHGATGIVSPQVRAMLESGLTQFDANQVATMPDPYGHGSLRVTFARFGIAQDNGIVVVGSHREGFPTEHDRLVLGVGANQVAAAVQRQRTEQALRRSEMLFRDLADTAPAMLWVTEPDGSCSFLSRGWYEFTGQNDGEGMGFGWTYAIHPEDRETAHKAFLSANERKQEFILEHRLLHSDGSYRWVIDMGRPRWSATGEFLGFVGNVLDITSRKQAEEALRETQSRLAAVFEILPVGVGVVDSAGKIVLSNQEMHRYLPTRIQPSLDDARHGRWRASHADGRSYARQDFPGARALRGERVVPGVEMLYQQDDGKEIWTQVAAVPVKDNSGKITGQVAVVTDIDALKRTEAALRTSEDKYRTLFNQMSQSNKHMSDFLAVLAHELRNPLAPIITGLEMLHIRADSPESVARVRDMMERQANQMVHLLNDLLDMARVSSGKIELKKNLVELNSIISSAVETSLPLIEAARHELSVKFGEKPLKLHVDSTRIAQVIGNLLTNAAKYTPQGGKITLTVEQEKNDAVISVNDNGVGIPSDSLSSVFEMFSQVGRNMEHSQGGLGIGLALVRNLVSLHDGTVTATSEGVGRGSTFTVRIPIGRPDENSNEKSQSRTKSGVSQRRLRILVADDNRDAAHSLASLLTVYCHDVEVVHDGMQALQVAQVFRPEVALLDIGMPGMTGYEVARRLRSIEGLDNIRIVAITGWGTEGDRVRAKEAGFDSHLTKPLALATLTKVIDEIQ